MKARVTVLRARLEAGGSHQVLEGRVDVRVGEPRAGGGDEERRRAGLRAELVAQVGVGAQCVGRGLVQRQQASVGELGVAHEQGPLFAAQVVSVQCDQLSDPHACCRQEADDGLVGGSVQREAQRPGRVHQGGDLCLGIQVGVGPASLAWQQVCWRHLGGRVEALQVGGEAAGDRQADRPLVGLAFHGGRPGERLLRGDGGRPGRLEMADQAGQQPAVAF